MKRAILAILTVTLLVSWTMGCSDKNDAHISSKKFHKSEFQDKGPLFSESEFQSLLKGNMSKAGASNTIARSMQLAGVGLVFDREGYLYTPDEFNQVTENIPTSTDNDTGASSSTDQMMDTYYTDLNTYSAVTSDPNAIQENTTGISGLDTNDENSSTYYVFDIYRKSYLSKETQMAKFREVASTFLQKGTAQQSGSPNPPYGIVGVGDVVLADKHTSSFGHAGIIIDLGPLNNSLLGGSLQSATTMEAVGERHHKRDEVVSRPASHYFMKSDLYYLAIKYRPNITYQQRRELADYALGQDPDPYGIFTSKHTGGTWYCSKLLWRAYKKKVGCNLDCDGGYWVTPWDIIGDASLVPSYGFIR